MAKETRKAGKKNRQAAGGGPLESNGEAFVVRALAKGLAMLSLFDAVHREWTLDEMVTELKLPRMTGYRMARTLQSAGYLVSDPQSGRYRLGPALLASTYLSEGYAELVAIARPYLDSLVEDTGESATLAVDVDGVAVCVDMVDSPRPHKREVAVGRVIGDTANAHGKMYAASMPDADRARLLDLPHERLTPKTITDPQELEAELRRVRERGRGVRHRGAQSRHLRRGRAGQGPDGQRHRQYRRHRADGPVRPAGARDLRRRGQSRGRGPLRLPGVRPDGPARRLIQVHRAAAAGSTPAAAALPALRARRRLAHLNSGSGWPTVRMQKVILQYH